MTSLPLYALAAALQAVTATPPEVATAINADAAPDLPPLLDQVPREKDLGTPARNLSAREQCPSRDCVVRRREFGFSRTILVEVMPQCWRLPLCRQEPVPDEQGE